MNADKMNIVDQMKAVISQFESGDIPKEEYWNRMLDFHSVLKRYKELINQEELSRIEITPSDIYVVLPNGLRFVWIPEDKRTAISHIVNDGMYERKERALLFHLVSCVKTVFDIGANIGWYSLHFSQLVKEKGGIVYSFEPVKDTYNRLRENVILNGAKNLYTFNNAFGDKKESATFYLPHCSGSVATSMRPLYDSASQEIECDVLRLDDFVVEHGIKSVDFIKCDVEGAELLVVKGGLDILTNHKPIVFVEMLRKWTAKFDYHPNKTIELFSNLGYRCYFNKDGRLIEIKMMDNDCMETNFYFLHKEKHLDLFVNLIGKD